MVVSLELRPSVGYTDMEPYVFSNGSRSGIICVDFGDGDNSLDCSDG